jgi:hypothetical protein
MSLEALQQAKSDALAARARFLSTLGETQQRLKPGNLAGEAWDGVKTKSANLAGSAVEGVKQRPVTASLVLGGLLLFLARAPLKRAVTGLIARRRERRGRGNKGGD